VDDKHVEPNTKPGDVRLMIDSAYMMEECTSHAPTTPSHASFAMLCDTVAEVNAVAAAIKNAGHTLTVEPWDAFWGQRHATVRDPDGYQIDVFAVL